MTAQPNEPLQNDPDRAVGSLVPDALGEFVADEPGGAFDPRSFRRTEPQPSDDERPGGTNAGGAPRPPVDDERMSGPGEEIDKTR